MYPKTSKIESFSISIWVCLIFAKQITSAISSASQGKTSNKNEWGDFPGGAVVKNPPAGLPWWRSGWESACQCRGHGFEPWSGKIPRATEQLGPWATMTEPARLEPVLHNKRGHDSERPAHCDEEWPPLATTRESPRTETKTQHSHKKNFLKKILKKKKKKESACQSRGHGFEP